MPLAIEVLDANNKVRKVRWDGTHLSCCLTAALLEGDPDFICLKDNRPISDVEDGQHVDFSWSPIYYFNTKCRLWTEQEIKLKRTHAFPLTDDEVFTLHAGDTIRMWREHK